MTLLEDTSQCEAGQQYADSYKGESADIGVCRARENKKFLHRALVDKAAAYGFHVCRNHPFVDGNKRIAFVLMDIFPQKNGWLLGASEEEAYETMTILADGRDKQTPALGLV